MSELIKERNEIAKQLLLNGNTAANDCVRVADRLMEDMYGSDWKDADEPNQEESQQPTNTVNPDATITIVERNGEKWVRVQALGEDFVIAPKDLEDGKGVMVDRDYDTLMKRLKELNLDTFDRKQGLIIAIYAEQINDKLIEAGGNKFAEDWYVSKELWHPVGSSADFFGNHSWCFNGYCGCFNNYYRYGGYFRSRPVLAYSAFQN